MQPSGSEYPGFSADIHFRDTPRFRAIGYDQAKAAELFEAAGFPAEAIPNSNLNVRPDYSLGYTRRERIWMFLRNPFHDNTSAECELNKDGGVDIAIVYGTAYGVNELLRHEAKHGAQMLAESKQSATRIKRYAPIAGKIGPLIIGNLAYLADHNPLSNFVGSGVSFLVTGAGLYLNARKDRADEAIADNFMQDKAIKRQYTNIIKVRKNPKPSGSAIHI
jgi:hypothetical protein